MPDVAKATFTMNDVDSSDTASLLVDVLKKVTMNLTQMLEIKLSLNSASG